MRDTSFLLLAFIGISMTAAEPTARPSFPVRIGAKILNPQAPAHVYLERDDSRRWQQYLDSTVTAADGAFNLEIQRPGLYWVVAQQGDGKTMLNGACLVEVNETGNATWRATPPGWPGEKYGGKLTKICTTGFIDLVPKYQRRKLVRAKRRRSVDNRTSTKTH
jgi:hypothetical protein